MHSYKNTIEFISERDFQISLAIDDALKLSTVPTHVPLFSLQPTPFKFNEINQMYFWTYRQRYYNGLDLIKKIKL